jgi:hypothetical protein
MTQPTLLERAFALAQSGDFETISEIRKALKREGYRDRDIVGPSLLKQLSGLCRASKKQEAIARPEPMW